VNSKTNCEQTDQELMKSYLSGDEVAFEILYLRYKDRVYSYLSKRLSRPQDRNEVFQNIFFKFHRSRHNYNQKYALLQWIYTISRSELVDFCRKKKISTTPLLESHFQVAAEEIPSNESIEIDSISSLSTPEKEAIKLKYFSEKDYQEISTQLNIRPSNARKIISRGLKKIKKEWGLS